MKQRSNHREFELMLEHYKSVVFTKGQLHCLKLLPEAMINASRALVCRVSKSVCWLCCLVALLPVRRTFRELLLLVTRETNSCHGFPCFLRLQVCSGALVLATHLVARRWGSVAIQVLEMLSCASAAGIVLSGAVVFERAIRGDGSHVQRLFLGFCSLRNTSRRLAYLLFVTATLQVVSQLVGMLAV